jgi:hypothetical protein
VLTGVRSGPCGRAGDAGVKVRRQRVRGARGQLVVVLLLACWSTQSMCTGPVTVQRGSAWPAAYRRRPIARSGLWLTGN